MRPMSKPFTLKSELSYHLVEIAIPALVWTVAYEVFDGRAKTFTDTRFYLYDLLPALGFSFFTYVVLAFRCYKEKKVRLTKLDTERHFG